MLSRLLFVCINMMMWCNLVSHSAHIPESILLRLKGKNGDNIKSATSRTLLEDETFQDVTLLEYSSDVTRLRLKRSHRNPEAEEHRGSILRKLRHSQRKNKEKKEDFTTFIETTETLQTENSNSTNSTYINEQFKPPMNQGVTNWSRDANACRESRRTSYDDHRVYPLCTICTAKTTFPEGTIPREIHETICLPSGNHVVRDDETNSCLRGFGRCKQRTKRIELRRLKVGPRPTHLYESEIEQDDWEYAHYDWRYSCDCEVRPGNFIYDFTKP
ncbi:uncharacterized protein [Antedon mediterranea]|uniref:uncharacterized protein n=1 Tax=Antedon mediterranea TaxID=105859 RepID=UPI003AF8B474